MSSDSPASTDADRICPRCGTDSGGAPWCPKCGLNLRKPNGESPPAAGPPAAGSPPATEPQPDYSLTQVLAAQTATSRRARNVAGAAAVGVIALVGAVALVLLGTHRSLNPQKFVRGLTHHHHGLTLPSRTGASGKAAGATGSGNGGGTGGTSAAITAADMRPLLHRYVLAYSSKSVAALKSLFAATFVRKNGTEPAENLSQALATYRGQFAHLTNPKYSLTHVVYAPGRAAAAGVYSITSAAGTAGGRITYHFVRNGNRLLIDRLVIRPS